MQTTTEKKTVNSANYKAIAKAAAARQPFRLRKVGEYHNRWETWNPNIRAMVVQDVTIEKWDKCTVTPEADGRVKVATTNARMRYHLQQLSMLHPAKCKEMGTRLQVASYTVERDLWAEWLAEHTEAEDHGKGGEAASEARDHEQSNKTAL